MIRIVDYAAGNITSVQRALKAINVSAEITADPDKIRSSSRIIFPGVGHATAAMQQLRQSGLAEALTEACSSGVAMLGICLGTQIIFQHSEETDLPCLGLLPGTCKLFRPRDKQLKVPHMGWNQISITREHPLFRGIKDQTDFYFVHSYYPVPAEDSLRIATCTYEQEFCAMVARDNLAACQFHPEKSGAAGLQILTNFATWEGSC